MSTAISDMTERMKARTTIERDPENPKNYLLVSEQWLPRPLPEVFEFFSNAANLQAITPDWLSFKILTPTPIEMKPGTLIDYRIVMRFMPLRWRTLISAWEPPHRFVDEQLKGPYRLWHHEHTFEEQDGGTLVRDRVYYRVPGGALIHALLVKRDVQKIFEHRGTKLAELFPPQE